jgi:hypothetical protein
MLYYPENMAKIKKLNSKAIPLKTNYSWNHNKTVTMAQEYPHYENITEPKIKSSLQQSMTLHHWQCDPKSYRTLTQCHPNTDAAPSVTPQNHQQCHPHKTTPTTRACYWHRHTNRKQQCCPTHGNISPTTTRLM